MKKKLELKKIVNPEKKFDNLSVWKYEKTKTKTTNRKNKRISD